MNRRVRNLNLGLDRYSGLYIWGTFIVIFSIWEPQLFLTMRTAHTIASEQSIDALLAIAVLVPLITGTYDLSVGAVANLSTITAIWLQTSHHFNMWPASFLAVALSAAIGVVNGFLVVKWRVNSFIATLGMGSVIGALQIIVSNNSQPPPVITSAWEDLTQRSVFGFQIVFVYMLIAAVVVWWALKFTPAGRYMYAVGGNPEAARLSGVKVTKWVWLSLVFSATVSGAAGVLYGSQSGPSLTYGQALLLPAFAAVFLGSTQLYPGRFNLWGTVLAIFVLATGVQGLEYVTGVQWLSDMFNGLALILAVAFAMSRQRNTRRSRRGGAYPEEKVPPDGKADLSVSDSAATVDGVRVPSSS